MNRVSIMNLSNIVKNVTQAVRRYELNQIIPKQVREEVRYILVGSKNQEIMSNLTEDQIKFIEECTLEFSDRFTDADLDYRKVYDEGIPPPPIMYPWYTRSRYNNRDRAGGSRYQEHGNRSYNQDRDNRSYSRGRNYNRYDRRDRPY